MLDLGLCPPLFLRSWLSQMVRHLSTPELWSFVSYCDMAHNVAYCQQASATAHRHALNYAICRWPQL